MTERDRSEPMGADSREASSTDHGMSFTADQLCYLASAVQRGVRTTLEAAEDAFAMLKSLPANGEVARNDVDEPVATDYGTQKETLRTMLHHQVHWLMETTTALDVGWKNEYSWLTLVGAAEHLNDRFAAWELEQRKDRQLQAYIPAQQSPDDLESPTLSESLMFSVMNTSALIAQRLGLNLRDTSSGVRDGRIQLEMSFDIATGE